MKYFHRKRKGRIQGRRYMALFVAVVMIVVTSSQAVTPGKASAAIALVSQNTSSATVAVASLAATTPAGVVTGNALIAQVFALPGTSNSVSITAPAGWTRIGTTVTANKYSMATYSRVVTATEPASHTFSFSPAATAMIGISAFSGTDTKAPVDVSAGQVNGVTTSHVAPSVSTSYNSDALLTLWGYQAGTTSSAVSGGLTNIWNTSAGSMGITNSYKLLNNAGATGTFTSTTPISASSLSMTIGLKPALAAAGVQFIAATVPAQCSNCNSQVGGTPSGTLEGHLMLTNVAWNGSVTLTAPAGWTQVDVNSVNGTYTSANFYRFVVNGDPTTYTWNFSGNATAASVSTVTFQGVDDLQPIDVFANAAGPSGTSHTAPSLTTNFAQDMLVNTYAFTASTLVDVKPTAMNQLWNAASSNNNSAVSVFAGYELQGLSGVTGTRTVGTGKNAFSTIHSIALKPFLPTPILVDPSNDTIQTLFPVYQLVNASLTATPQQYRIQLCSTANCDTIITVYDQTLSQTGWSGQDADAGTSYVGSTEASGSTTATYTTQTALTPCTQYYWRGVSYDTFTQQVSNPSNINRYKTSCIPAAPTLFSPPASSGNIPLQPEFRVAATDADADPLRYRIQLCSNITCSAVMFTWDQSFSQDGWSGQDQLNFTAHGSDATSSSVSTSAYYSFKLGSLTPNVTYYWRAYATDPTGTNLWSPSSPIQSFTTNLSETKILEGRLMQGTIL